MAQPKTPIITFKVALQPDLISQLHPDRHQTDQDIAQAQAAHRASLRNTYIPGLLRGENIEMKHDGTFTLYGMKAAYVKETYATNRPGQPAILVVVSETSAAETPGAAGA